MRLLQLPPSLCVALAVVLHVAHTILGLPMLEGCEQAILSLATGRTQIT